MDRLFLDANVLFSAAYRSHAGLLKLWKFEDVVLCSSRYALEEARINLGQEAQRTILADLSSSLTLVEACEAQLPSGIVIPEKDVPILLGAMTARATHLLTGDKRHFGRYFGKKVAGIRITTPSTYINARE